MMQKESKEISIVKEAFKSYYDSIDPNEIIPKEVEKREFGFGDFEEKISARHFSFKSGEELIRYIKENTPAHINFSTAYYSNPSGRPMENKGLIKNDLVFDIDATDLKLECKIRHGNSWICQNCLERAKNEAIRLIEDFLIPDFGVSKDEIEVNFSGSRGYHVRVEREDMKQLGEEERREIVDYITGRGIISERIFDYIKGRGIRGPTPESKGWPGKVARSVISALDSKEKLESLGIDRKASSLLTKKRQLVEMGIRSGNWDMVDIKKKEAFWKNVVSAVAIMQSDNIDRNVTIESSHLIRLPNTLHGGSGLVAKKLRNYELSSFDPMKHAIAFRSGELEVFANTKEELLMNGISFGPYDNQKVSLPSYAAIYLLLKGFARIS
ncbi:MAG: DNA primase catalytic subunit PriS [Candidatus Micrarchaeaceae archaeon]